MDLSNMLRKVSLIGMERKWIYMSLREKKKQKIQDVGIFSVSNCQRLSEKKCEVTN